MIHLLKAIASILIVLIIGYALLILIFRNKPVCKKMDFIFSLGLGFGLLAEYCLVCLTVAKRIDFKVVYAALALSLGWIIYKKRKSEFLDCFSFCSLRRILSSRKSSRWPALPIVTSVLCVCLIAVILTVVSYNLAARPMYQFDSRAIWGMKAKILFFEHTILSEAVEEISSSHPHPRYPLLLPIASAWIFENLGEADDRAVRLLFLAFFVGIVMVVFQFQRSYGGDFAAILSVSALLLVPFLYRSMRPGASSGHADLIVSFYITASAVAMISWIRKGNHAFLTISTFLAVGAALTKNEGVAFIVNLFLTTALFSLVSLDYYHEKDPGNTQYWAWLRGNAPRIYRLAAHAFIAGVLLLPSLYVRSSLPQFLDENYLHYLNLRQVASNLDRLPEVLKILFEEFLNIKDWGAIWILIMASMIGIGKTWKKESYFFFILILLQVAGYLIIFIITSNDVTWQMGSALPRLLLHILPLGVMLLFFQLFDLKDESSIAGISER